MRRGERNPPGDLQVVFGRWAQGRCFKGFLCETGGGRFDPSAALEFARKHPELRQGKDRSRHHLKTSKPAT